jgi:hypothetical protein
MNAERPANQADEEAPLLTPPIIDVLPPEISFRSSSYQRRPSFNDDDNNSLPSELSSLMPLSTLTPNYNPELAHQLCHHSNPSSSDDQTSITSKKAFRLAALLAILSFAVLACVDVLYFVSVSTSKPETNDSASPQLQRSIEEEESKKPKADKKKKKKKKKDPKEVDGDGDQNEGFDTKMRSQVSDKMDSAQEGTSFGEGADVANSNLADSSSSGQQKSGEVLIPSPEKRCAYVVNTFEEQNKGFDTDFLRDKYKAQSVDPNVFYRATAVSNSSYLSTLIVLRYVFA